MREKDAGRQSKKMAEREVGEKIWMFKLRKRDSRQRERERERATATRNQKLG